MGVLGVRVAINRATRPPEVVLALTEPEALSLAWAFGAIGSMDALDLADAITDAWREALTQAGQAPEDPDAEPDELHTMTGTVRRVCADTRVGLVTAAQELDSPSIIQPGAAVHDILRGGAG